MIVDDHPLVREGLIRAIAMQSDLCVCGEAANAAETWQKLSLAMPDAMLVDLSLPGPSGMDLIRDLHSRYPELPMLVLSMHEERFYAERALRAGARGYLMKQEPVETILEALRTVLRGELYLSPKMSGQVLKVFLTGRKTENVSEDPIKRLSNRELQVLEMIGRGLSTVQISERLHLSRKTIETYRAHLKHKLGLESGNELIHQAVRWVDNELAGTPPPA